MIKGWLLYKHPKIYFIYFIEFLRNYTNNKNYKNRMF
jgi:hypothetical protein